jgi:hypothetical protein
MPYVSEPFWWIVCDEPGCEVKSTEGGEYTAWGDKGAARDEAVDSDWAETTDGLFFCSEHRDRACSECSKHVPGGADVEHDSMCDECWAGDAKENHGRKVPWASSSGHGEFTVNTPLVVGDRHISSIEDVAALQAEQDPGA